MRSIPSIYVNKKKLKMYLIKWLWNDFLISRDFRDVDMQNLL